MKHLLRIFFIVTAISSQACTALSPPPEPQLTDLATAWLGSSPGYSSEYFRLELDTSGNGILVVQYLPEYPAELYKVSVSQLKRYDIKFDVREVDKNAEPIFLRGYAETNTLQLEVGGVERKWKRKIFLEKEERVLGRIQIVTERARKAHQSE